MFTARQAPGRATLLTAPGPRSRTPDPTQLHQQRSDRRRSHHESRPRMPRSVRSPTDPRIETLSRPTGAFSGRFIRYRHGPTRSRARAPLEHRSSAGAAPRSDDRRGQRTSRRPGFCQRAPFEHRNVHMRPTKDLVDRMCAGQKPATGAPPGTRTPNPRIKSPDPAVSPQSGACRLVSFPQVGAGGRCRHVSVDVGYFHGHRAPIEHRTRWSVLDRRTKRGAVTASRGNHSPALSRALCRDWM
jgi:hypothetical protein